MSEIEARKYTSIRMLREEIRQDMQDYKLLWTEKDLGEEKLAARYLLNPTNNNIRAWFSIYLTSQINNNLSKLQELVEQENE